MELGALDRPSVRTHILETQLGGPHREIIPDSEVQALIDKMLKNIDINFALVSISPGAAILVSRYENAVRDHAGPPKRCYCENPNFVHAYDNKKSGDACDFDTFKVDCRR